ncbi:hypothetical protein DFH09DRAFT_1101228 [Mycena vulgaris]|nr:hypothetical protein DFH09DRAFT_1101228 [Mycena vulgaris]
MPSNEKYQSAYGNTQVFSELLTGEYERAASGAGRQRHADLSPVDAPPEEHGAARNASVRMHAGTYYGLFDVELLQCNLPLENILACKSSLLSTALAYMDDQSRLKASVPIREYLQKEYPPTTQLIRPLLKHFQELLELYTTHSGTLLAAQIVHRIISNFSNIQNVLLNGLNMDNPDLCDTLHSICRLDNCSGLAGRGQLPLLNQIPGVLPHARDPKLEVYFIIQVLQGCDSHPVSNAQQLIDRALQPR